MPLARRPATSEVFTTGIEVATITSTEGGAFSKTFNIPAELAGETMISIRLESTVGGFYSYDWFYNTTTP